MREDAIEWNRKLKADIVRETWRSGARPTKKLDDSTLLFGDENGAHQIKRFYPEHQSYGIIKDTTAIQDSDDLKCRLVKEMERGTDVTEDDLTQLYQSQLDFKKSADPYFPTIVGGLPMAISMYSTAWLEATILEKELLAEYFRYRAEIAVKHIKWLAGKGFRFINGGGDLV